LPTSDKGDAPPLPPPKDGPKRSFSPSFYSEGPSCQAKHSTSTEGSNGSRGNTINGYSKSPHDVGFSLTEVHISCASKPGLNPQSSKSLPVSPPLPAKYFNPQPFRPPSGPPRQLPTPAERAKARIEAEREKELETCLAIRQEEERQARIKVDKEEQRRREEEAEARRKAKIEQDIRIAQLLKKQRQHEQAEAEEKFAQEAEERRKANKEKRMQGGHKSQAQMIEQERSKEKVLLEKESEKKRKEEEKMQERKRLFETMKAEHSGRLELSGWISVQQHGSVTWRRRWFTFDGKFLNFFKAQNDASPVDILYASEIRDVRNDGGPSEEEPAFIPNSFVVEDIHRCCWPLFTDTSDTMEKVMAALIFSSEIHKTSTP